MGRTPAYTSASFASTTPFAGEPPHDPLESVRVFLIEGGTAVGINVEHGEQRTAFVEDRNDDLRLRPRITCNVAGKTVDVGNDDRFAFGGGRSTHAATESYVQ